MSRLVYEFLAFLFFSEGLGLGRLPFTPCPLLPAFTRIRPIPRPRVFCTPGSAGPLERGADRMMSSGIVRIPTAPIRRCPFRPPVRRLSPARSESSFS